MFRGIWHYRNFIVGLVKRDFKDKYLNSVLGFVWAILHPLTTILVYTLIFSQVMQAKLSGIGDPIAYSIYLCSGIITWQLFSEVLTRTQNVFLEQASLLKKVNFPKLTLPIYIVLTTAINFLILIVLFIVFLVITGRAPDLSITSLIPLLLIQQAFAIGIGIFLGTINVFFRDIGHGMSIVLQFWFWFTPIVYPSEIIPEKFNWILQLNPMMSLIQSYQDIFLFGFWPIWSDLIYASLIALGSLALGYITFKKFVNELVDEL